MQRNNINIESIVEAWTYSQALPLIFMFSFRNSCRFQSFYVVNLYNDLNKLYNLLLMLHIIKTSQSFSPELLIAQLTAPFHHVYMPQSLKVHLS